MKASNLHGLDKGGGLMFYVGYQVQQETLKEGQRTYQPKHWEYYKDEDNSLKTLNNKNQKWVNFFSFFFFSLSLSLSLSLYNFPLNFFVLFSLCPLKNLSFFSSTENGLKYVHIITKGMFVCLHVQILWVE